jgi:hypothetical protein
MSTFVDAIRRSGATIRSTNFGHSKFAAARSRHASPNTADVIDPPDTLENRALDRSTPASFSRHSPPTWKTIARITIYQKPFSGPLPDVLKFTS